MEITNATTLREVIDDLLARIDDGAECPCCGQFAKVYRRKLNERIGRILIAMWHKAGTDWIYLPSIGGSDNTDVPAARSGEHAFAQFWGLIERNTAEGGRGHWRLTPHGADFVHDRVKIPKYARIYNGELLGLVEGEQVSITDVLGTPFIYAELMAGV